MVRLTTALFRVPVIKFRKGGGSQAGRPPSAPAAAPASAAPTAAPAPVQTQQTVTMSTISDVDLPPRYRRAPLTQEEIDHINGGGIV
ncbi:uncharacterized protein LOC106717801 [Papilio machaon]|uniref:uncharacterized protein LOC106717801 n=1 Tax=Papilio machaon TaxID=76193 RepID=UPI0006EB0040|nr:uncharacterized protein LOC106717801 [Papilio machaon]